MTPLLTRLVQDLQQRHGCHTIVLYGSHARGDATPASDYDLACVRAEGPDLQDARLWEGVYLDVFVYAEASLLQPDESLLRLRGGRVLLQKDDWGTALLARVEELERRGPTPLSADRGNALRVWADKMLARIELGDIEANYRRAWLLTSLLEDYFSARGLWYRGPKESLHALRHQDPAAFAAFDAALKPGAPPDTLQRLVQTVHPPLQGA